MVKKDGKRKNKLIFSSNYGRSARYFHPSATVKAGGRLIERDHLLLGSRLSGLLRRRRRRGGLRRSLELPHDLVDTLQHGADALHFRGQAVLETEPVFVITAPELAERVEQVFGQAFRVCFAGLLPDVPEDFALLVLDL